MILYFAADLLWATRIKATAEALSLPCRPVRNAEMLRARLADTAPPGIQGLIVDLDAPEVALELIGLMRGRAHTATDHPAQDKPLDADGRIRILAFGPHVEVELFEKARQIGADVVLARGAFDRRLPEILQELAARGGPAGGDNQG